MFTNVDLGTLHNFLLGGGGLREIIRGLISNSFILTVNIFSLLPKFREGKVVFCPPPLSENINV